MREIDTGNGQLLSEEETKKLWRRQGKCDVCGLVMVAEKIPSRNPFQRNKHVLITTDEVFEGFHLSCHGGHNSLMKYYKDKGYDLTGLTAHYEKFKQRLARSLPLGGELAIPIDHFFFDDDEISAISNISAHVQATNNYARTADHMAEIPEDGSREDRSSRSNSNTARSNSNTARSNSYTARSNSNDSFPSNSNGVHRRDRSREISLASSGNHETKESESPTSRNEKIRKKIEAANSLICDNGRSSDISTSHHRASSNYSATRSTTSNETRETDPQLCRVERMRKKIQENDAIERVSHSHSFKSSTNSSTNSSQCRGSLNNSLTNSTTQNNDNLIFERMGYKERRTSMLSLDGSVSSSLTRAKALRNLDTGTSNYLSESKSSHSYDNIGDLEHEDENSYDQTLGKSLDEIIMDDLSYKDTTQKYRKIFDLMREKNTDAAFIRIAFLKIRQSIFSLSENSRNTASKTSASPCPSMREWCLSRTNKPLLPSSWSKHLIAAMEQHSTNIPVQAEALHTFGVLVSINTSYKDDFIGCTGVDATVKSLQKNLSSIKIAEMGTSLLLNLALSESLRRSLYSNSNIVDVMANLFRVPRRIGDGWLHKTVFISRCSLQTIQLLVEIDLTKKANKRNNILTKIAKHEDFLQNLIYGIEDCSFDKGLILHIFRFIATLSSISEDEILEDINVFLESPRLLRAVAKTTKSTTSWETLQVISSVLVANLSKRDNIGSSDILPLAENLFSVMVKYTQLESVQINGFTSILNLCYIDPQNQSALYDFGGIKLIMSYLNNNLSNNLITERGFQAISALSNDSTIIKNEFVEEGGIKVLLHTLRINSEDNLVNPSSVIEQIFYLLAEMLEISSVISTLIEDGFFRLISSESILRNIIEMESFKLLLRNLISIGECKNDFCDSLVKALLESDFILHTSICDLDDSIDIVGYIFLSGRHMKGSSSLARKKVDYLIRVLNMCQDSIYVQKTACKVISKLYLTHGEDIHLLTDESVEIVSPLSVLLHHSMKPELHLNACLAIFYFIKSLNSDATNEFIDFELSNVMSVMTDILEHTHVQPIVIEMITGLIWTLSMVNQSLENKVFAGKCPELLIDAFMRFETAEHLQKEILGFIVHSQILDYDLSHLLCKESFIRAIFKSLSRNFEIEEFVERGCKVIALLSMDVFYMQDLIVNNIEFLETLVGLLYRHNQSVNILIDIYTSFKNFSMHVPVKKFLSSQGIISLAMESVNINSENEDLSQMASAVICNLIRVAETDILDGLDIVSFCLSTISSNIETEHIVEKTLYTFHALATKSNIFKSQIIEKDVARAVINIMGKYLGSDQIQETGCLVLWTLTSSHVALSQICQLGGIQAILNGMSAHVDSESLQQEALGALKALAARPFTRKIIMDNEGVEIIIGDMWYHQDKEVIQSFGLMALSNCAYDTEKDEVIMITNKELEAVANAMAKFPNSERIQENACRLVRNYTFQRENTSLIITNEKLLKSLAFAETRFPLSCEQRAIDIRDALQEYLFSC